MSRREIGYLRFICESYEGLFFLRTLDPQQALVEVSYAPERQQDAEGLFAALQEETGWQDVSSRWNGKFAEL